MENARRRWPAVRIVTRYALVQGPQACEQVIAAVQHLDRHPAVDVIVIARGGGSVEDLLPFSDEGLIRAVAACRTPVVSAIGHESTARSSTWWPTTARRHRLMPRSEWSPTLLTKSLVCSRPGSGWSRPFRESSAANRSCLTDYVRVRYLQIRLQRSVDATSS